MLLPPAFSARSMMESWELSASFSENPPFLSFNHPAQLSAEQIAKRQYMITNNGQLIQITHHGFHGPRFNAQSLGEMGSGENSRSCSVLIGRSIQFWPIYIFFSRTSRRAAHLCIKRKNGWSNYNRQHITLDQSEGCKLGRLLQKRA